MYMNNTEAMRIGTEDFKTGAPRMVPQAILVGNNVVGNGINAAKAWYAGWDKANMEAAW